MARIRTFKPEFFVSESLAEVSIYAERTFGGLITQVDDEGRYKDNAAILHGAIWALRPEHTAVDVENDLMALAAAGLICRYAVGGKRYLHLLTFGVHQKISHATPSKLPACPHDHYGGQDTDLDSGAAPDLSGELPNPFGKPPESSGAAPIGSGKEVEVEVEWEEEAPSSAPPPLPLASLTEPEPTFEDFWKPWPRKLDKEPARKAFDKAIKKASAAVIVDACRAYAERCQQTDQDPQFIPHATTWLNKERWTNDLDAVMPLPAARSSPENRGHQAYRDPDPSVYYNPKARS